MDQEETIFQILSEHLRHKVFIEPVYKRTALASVKLDCRNCNKNVIAFDNPDAVIPPVGPWEKDLFFYYNSPMITGYHDPYVGLRGFRTPAFERDTFLAWFALTFPHQRVYYDPNQDAIFCQREGHIPDFQWIEGLDVQTVEGYKHLYAPINWLWETTTKEGKCKSCGYPFSAHGDDARAPRMGQEIGIFQILSEHFHHKAIIQPIVKRIETVCIKLSCQHCSIDIVIFDNPHPLIPPFEPWEKNIFAIDDSRGIIGYYDLYEYSDYWRAPAFERNELLTWIGLEPEYQQAQYDAEQDTIYCHPKEDDYYSRSAKGYKGFDVSTVDGLKHLYGPVEWIWDIISETEALSRDLEHERKVQDNVQRGACSNYEWKDDDDEIAF